MGNLRARDTSLVVQTCDKSMEFGPYYMGRGGGEFKISAAALLVQQYLMRNADAPNGGAKEAFVCHAVFTILR